MPNTEISRRDLIKVGVAAAAGSVAILRAGGSASALALAKDEARGVTIVQDRPTGVRFDDGTTAPLVGFGDSYVPEVGDRVAVVGGVAYPILTAFEASVVEVSGSTVRANGKSFRAINSVSTDSSPGVLLLLHNEKTGENKCIGIQRG